VARIDDYRESLRLATQELKAANPHRLAKLAGADLWITEEGLANLSVPFFEVLHLIRVGETVQVLREGDDGEVSLPEQILLCHYLLHASGEVPTGEFITFRQIPDGHFYFDAFQRRARDPFLATFGTQPERFRRCAEMLGAQPVPAGDVGMSFQVFPRIAVQLVLWHGDEEFPPEASILFDAGIPRNLAAEDIAVVSGMLVYRLMGLARSEK
jgi:hypothetical protein